MSRLKFPSEVPKQGKTLRALVFPDVTNEYIRTYFKESSTAFRILRGHHSFSFLSPTVMQALRLK